MVSANSSDVYELGVTAYSLSLAKHPKASEIFDKFYALRVETQTEIQWRKIVERPPNSWFPPSSLDIELTAYGLSTILVRGDNPQAAVKIVKYITKQSNNFGGFSSSQDTVVALLALSEFAKIFSSNGEVEITLNPTPSGSEINAKINSENSLLVQEFELSSSVRGLNINAFTKSSGIALISLIANFFQDPSKVDPLFNISYNFTIACTSRILFEVCAAFVPSGTSNMAIMTVSMPSGFVYQDFFPQNNPDVSKVEVSNQESLVTFYFNSIGNKFSCVSVNAYRKKTVRDLKGGTIEVNDYYDTSELMRRLKRKFSLLIF